MCYNYTILFVFYGFVKFRLELTSADIMTKPKLNANYLSHELDRQTFVEVRLNNVFSKD